MILVGISAPLQKPNNPILCGPPAVRLDAVIRSVPSSNRQLSSICDSSYESAMQGLGTLIVSRLGVGCIPSPFPSDRIGDCVVSEVSPTSNGALTTPIPTCKDTGGAKPCWQLVVRNQDSAAGKACPPTCQPAGDPAQQLGIEILRDTEEPGAQTQVACATVAVTAPGSGDPDNPLGCN